MRRPIIVTRADGIEEEHSSIREVLRALDLHPPSVHRALKHRNPLNKGPLRGWSFRYADTPLVEVERAAPAVVEEYVAYPRNRHDARAQGATHYFTGYPCKHGHLALRKAQGACVECLRETWDQSKVSRKEYFEAYRKRPDVVARAKAYYASNKGNAHVPAASSIPKSVLAIFTANAVVKAQPPTPEPEPEAPATPSYKPTYKELIEQARVKRV